MADIRWIKLTVDMFDDNKIKLIQAMPDGDSILVIWIRIIALAGKCNANGLVLVEDEFPYTDEMLATIFNKPLPVVRLALATFEKFKMIENTQKGIYITNFEKHQNIEGMERIREQNRIRQQRAREKKKSLLESSNTPPALPDPQGENDVVTDCVTLQERDREREITHTEIEEEIEEDNISISPNGNIDIVGHAPTADEPADEPKREKLHYNNIKGMFNSICKDLPGIKAVSDARKRQIRLLLNEFEKLEIMPGLTGEQKLAELFKAVQESDFLTGRSGKWGKCSFDWIINKTNALKILEGNYTNKGGAEHGRTGGYNAGNNGGDYGAANGTLESTTAEALERFRRNRNNPSGV